MRYRSLHLQVTSQSLGQSRCACQMASFCFSVSYRMLNRAKALFYPPNHKKNAKDSVLWTVVTFQGFLKCSSLSWIEKFCNECNICVMTSLTRSWICNLVNVCLFPDKLIGFNFVFANSCSAGIQCKYWNKAELFPISITSGLEHKSPFKCHLINKAWRMCGPWTSDGSN